MTIGMLWYNNDPTTSLLGRVMGAADYYEKKYGQRPNYCVVNINNDFAGIDNDSSPIRIVGKQYILPGHLWIGMMEKV